MRLIGVSTARRAALVVGGLLLAAAVLLSVAHNRRTHRQMRQAALGWVILDAASGEPLALAPRESVPDLPTDLTAMTGTSGTIEQDGRTFTYQRSQPVGDQQAPWLVVHEVPTGRTPWYGLDSGSILALVAGILVLGAAMASQRHLARAALIDPLTGLPNRRQLQQRMDAELRSARRSDERIAVLLLDLDRFKEVNDTLGHHQGDRLLVDVAARLRPLVRADDVFARLGGDEFAVLVTDTVTSQSVLDLGHRLVSALATPFDLAGRAIQIGGSIGIAICPDHGTTEQHLLRCADTAMYQAKRGRLGAVIYTEQSDSNSERRLALAADIVAAVGRHQIVVLYQPRFVVATGEFAGVEALVRWNHPELGMITPTEFISLAEDTGAIASITARVVSQVFEHWAPERRLGGDINVSINLSTRDLLDPELALMIGGQLRRWSIDGKWLTFEITETAAIADEGTAAIAISTIRSFGARISIDDFGTGYFSLAGLRRMPLDELKIDKSFVGSMLTSTRDAHIVRAIIRLGHDLGVKVVAEGVESEAVLEALRRLECDEAQGFHLGRPMVAGEIKRWLDRQPLPAPR